MKEISKILSNEIRIVLILFAYDLKQKGVNEFKASTIISNECLGEGFDKTKEGKNIQAHLALIVEAGIFTKCKRVGYYSINTGLLLQYAETIKQTFTQ